MSQSFVISLPWPPSVNTYWRSLIMPLSKERLSLRKGKLQHRVAVILSEEGRKYRELVQEQVWRQRPPRLTGKLAVWIHAMPPDRRARDLDNLPKGVLDGLAHAGVFRDDCDIDDLRISRFAVRPGGQLAVQISEIAGEPTDSGELFRSEWEVA